MHILDEIKRYLKRKLGKKTSGGAHLHIDKIYHTKEYRYHDEQAERHTKLAAVFKSNPEKKVHHEMQAIHHFQLMAKHNGGRD